MPLARRFATLGYDVSALHVNHGLRGEESDEDARFCRERLGAEVVDGGGGTTEDELRRIRYGFATDRLRATGHTLSDQVETILYRLVTSGNAEGHQAEREDGVVRPLLCVWRDETRGATARAQGLALPRGHLEPRHGPRPDPRRGAAAAATHPSGRGREPPARARGRGRRCRPALAELIASPVGSKRVDLGGGVQAVREYDRLWLEQSPVALDGEVALGAVAHRVRPPRP